MARVAPPGNLPGRLLGCVFCALVEAAETVNVDVAGVAPAGVTVAGEKLQVAPVGRPEQVNVVAEAKPFWAVTERVAVPVCPGVMVSDAGETVTVKLGVGMLMV